MSQTDSVQSNPTFAEFCEQTHAAMVEKKWWPKDKRDRPLSEIFANFHAEVSEAFELYRQNRIRVDYHDGKPEGFWIDVADLVTRVADYCGSREFKLPDSVTTAGPDPEPVNYPSLVMRLHRAVHVTDIAAMREPVKQNTRQLEAELANLVRLCFSAAEADGEDLWALLRLKAEYNKTRAERHGGKLA